MTPRLMRVGRRRQRVWLGSRIGSPAETGTHVTVTAWSTLFLFSLLSFFLFFALSLPLFPSPSPPSLCRYLPLLRVASSVRQISCIPFMSMYAVLLLIAAFLISLGHSYQVFCFLSEFIFALIVFSILFSGLAFVAFSVRVRLRFTCFTDELAILLVLGVLFSLTAAVVSGHR